MADEEDIQVNQDEIEALLANAKAAASEDDAAEAAAPPEVQEELSLGQDEIEALLGGSAMPTPAASGASGEGVITHTDVEMLLNQAEAAIASIDDPTDNLPPGIKPFGLDDLTGSPATTEAATIELVRDVQLDLKIELGRTHMHLEDVLRMKSGSVVPLDKLAGDPVDVYVNGRLIARGEVLVLNDNFCVRITELVAAENAA